VLVPLEVRIEIRKNPKESSTYSNFHEEERRNLNEE